MKVYASLIFHCVPNDPLARLKLFCAASPNLAAPPSSALQDALLLRAALPPAPQEMTLSCSTRAPKAYLPAPIDNSSNTNTASLPVLVWGTKASSPSAEKLNRSLCIPIRPCKAPCSTPNFACLASNLISLPLFLNTVAGTPESSSVC